MMEIDKSIGGLLDRRYSTLTVTLPPYIAPLIAQLEHSAEAVNRLDAELQTISSLFEVALKQERPPFQALCDLLKQLNKYLNLRGLYGEQLRWAQELLTYFLEHEVETGDTIDLAVLNTIATGFERMGDYEDALDIYDFIIGLYADDPYHPGLAVICYNTALIHQHQEHIEQALALCQRAMEIDAREQNRRGMAMEWMLLADLRHDQGDIPGGFQAMQEAFTLIETLENRDLRAQFASKFALKTARYVDAQRALTLFPQAIALWREIGDDEQLAFALFNYAGLLHEIGRTSEAFQPAEESLALFERHNLFHAETSRAAIAEWQSNRAK